MAHYTYDFPSRTLTVRGSFLFLLNGYNLTRITKGRYKMPSDVETVQMYSEWLEKNSPVKVKKYTAEMLTIGDHVLTQSMTLFVKDEDVMKRDDDCIPRFCVWDEETDTHPLFTESVAEVLEFINDLD